MGVQGPTITYTLSKENAGVLPGSYGQRRHVTQGGTRGCLWAGGGGESLRPSPMRGDGRADAT